jgi:hypothetical protein
MSSSSQHSQFPYAKSISTIATARGRGPFYGQPTTTIGQSGQMLHTKATHCQEGLFILEYHILFEYRTHKYFTNYSL